MITIYYDNIDQMLPREGVKYATRYLKQQPHHRKELYRHVRDVTVEIQDYLEDHPEYIDWHWTKPLKGFPKTQGQKNRTTMEIVQDMINEAAGKKKNKEPKDFAMAPIERWNKLFSGTDWEIELVQYNPQATFEQNFIFEYQ
jgi:hypothetical protein